MPIKPAIRDRLTTSNAVEQGQRMPGPTAESAPAFTSALDTHNFSSGRIVSQPTASKPRTDTASLASSRPVKNDDATTKGSTLSLPTLSLSAITEPTADKPVTAGNPEERSVKETEDEDLQGLGSGSTLALNEELPVPLPTLQEMAQYRPHAQTAISKTPDVKTPPPERHILNLTPARKISTTAQTEMRATLSPVVTQATPRPAVLTGENLNILESMLLDRIEPGRATCLHIYITL